MKVFYCHNIYEHTKTGGEILYSKILDDLKNRPDIDLILPTEADLNMVNRPNGCLGINRYFFNCFRHLPERTIVIEGEHFKANFFLVNWLIKLCRNDVRIVVQVCQLPDPLSINWKSRLIRRIMLFLLLRSAERITVLSRFLKKEMVTLGALEEKVRVVGIAAQPLNQSKIWSVRNHDDSIRLLCVAHIRPLKGQEILIKALHSLQNNRVKLSMVGGIKDKNYELKIKSLVEELGLVKQVQFVGRLEGDDLSKAYQEADIFILPSLYEAYGIVVQEAMSFGLPVVVSDVGGIPEQVSDGVEGFIVPPNDPDALVNVLNLLVADPKLRIKMGKRGRERAAKLFTWDQVCERFYHTVLEASFTNKNREIQEAWRSDNSI